MPDAKGLRPTTDRVRETLFNWLAHEIHGKKVLDLYAGSGALGFEAASRGAAQVDLVDQAPKATQLLLKNQDALSFHQIKIHRKAAQRFLQQSDVAYDLIFLDPPFESDELNAISAIISDNAAPDALLYREYRKSQDICEMDPTIWTLYKQKTAGQVCFELWEKNRSNA